MSPQRVFKQFPPQNAFRLAGIISFSFWIAFLLRFDFDIPKVEHSGFFRGLLIAVVAKTTVWLLTGLNLERWWRYQGFRDLVLLLRTNLIAAAVSGLLIFVVVGASFPRSVYCLDFLVCLLTSSGLRFATRLYLEWRAELSIQGSERGLLIYGAGVAGISLAREIRDNPKLGYRVIGFIDDDFRKRGAKITGVPVLGSGNDLKEIVRRHENRAKKVQELVVAMPSASGRQIRTALEKGKAAGIPSRVVPGLGELISGTLAPGKMRDLCVNDLLGRDAVELDMDVVERATTGRCILVTGAAGSIGSELCSQLAQFQPRMLIALDQAESELFRLENDLLKRYPDLTLVIEVGDIRDTPHMASLFEWYAVNSIYHAAAYKHVPMMERQVCEAVRNNVLGTWSLAQAAWRAKVSHFLLISSDKAVNPTSIMGLTKRIAELIVSADRPCIPCQTGTKFVCVRFGNVLVSNGSVVPIFQKQIAAGGPVTVTHSEMRRYFMTVQEAAQLVLQASVMCQGGEIYVLEMGKPVKIVDLARKMIMLAGFVPDEDIEIRFTGLRCGEKMFEEINLDTESILPTTHPKIRIFKGNQLTLAQLVPWIAELQFLLRARNTEAVISYLTTLVPEYRRSTAQTIPTEAVAEVKMPTVTTTAVSVLGQSLDAAAG